jgi:hypothetical protein
MIEMNEKDKLRLVQISNGLHQNSRSLLLFKEGKIDEPVFKKPRNDGGDKNET